MAAINRLAGLAWTRPFPTVGYAPVRGIESESKAFDRVELSNEATSLSIATTAPVRAEKVAAVRASIERGDYSTDDKLDLALDALLREI